MENPPWKISGAMIDGLLAERKGSTVFKALHENPAIKLSVYSPRGRDAQNMLQPFERAEVYIVRSGSATFTQSGEKTRVEKGDVLLVAPRAFHNYEDMSQDFSALLIMYDLETEARAEIG